MNDDKSSNQQPPRKRGLTSVTLQWLSEKLRRTERIKEALQQGKYEVDSNKVAQAIINSESPAK